MRARRVSGAARLAVIAMTAALLTPFASAQAVNYPNASVTTPNDGDPATGVVTITGEGHTDPLGLDTVSTLTLRVDGTATGPAVDCTTQGTPNDCTGSFTWDTSGATSGDHSITVQLATTLLATATSPAITLTKPYPAPTVMINSETPSPGSVNGSVTVNATGTSTDPALNPTQLDLLRDGTQVDTATCSGPSTSCTRGLTWDGTPVHGVHSLVVRMEYGASSTLDSSSISYTGNPPPLTSVTAGARNGAVVPVVATVTFDGTQSDGPGSMDLRIKQGGSTLPGVLHFVCPSGPSDCTHQFDWDATGRTGTYQAQVTFNTSEGNHYTDSDSISVSAVAPQLTITSPTAGLTETGVVPVVAHGVIDASQNDTAHQMQLFVSGSGTAVDTQLCPSTRDCTLTLHWNATGQNRAATLTVQLTTANDEHASDSVAINVSTAPPVASVAAPADGATVSGTVNVAAAGAIDPSQSDSPETMQLLVDGAFVSPTAQPCAGTPAAPLTCSVPYSWDTTGLSGRHTLQAEFVTHNNLTVRSTVTTITVYSPPPTATVLSPGSLSTVHRAASVVVAGKVDPSQTDSPASMVLLVDGIAVGTAQPCQPAITDSRSCQVAFNWTTTGLTGQHQVGAMLTTAKGATAAAAPRAVFVYGGTVTVLAKIKTQHASHRVTVTGRVTALINAAPVIGVRVKIAIVPIKGKTSYVYVRTNVHGYFTLTVKPRINTTVEATVVAVDYYGSSHTYTKLRVLPALSCKGTSTLVRNHSGQGICHAANLPKGTKLTLQYAFHGRWFTLGQGKAPGTTVPFRYRFGKPGAYLVRLVLSSSSVFAGVSGPSLKVTVR